MWKAPCGHVRSEEWAYEYIGGGVEEGKWGRRRSMRSNHPSLSPSQAGPALGLLEAILGAGGWQVVNHGGTPQLTINMLRLGEAEVTLSVYLAKCPGY